MSEGWVLASGSGIISATGSGDIDTKDIFGESTGNSGGVGGHLDYF